jgi:AcrR family transcriptional regulator
MIHDMTPTVRDEQTNRTRERIIRACADLALNEHPAAFSVPEVARRAGVSTRTVYRYYPTKEALLDGLVWLGGQPGRALTTPELEGDHTVEAYLEQIGPLFAELHKNAEYLRVQASNPVLRETRSRRVRQRHDALARSLPNEVDLPAVDTDRLAALICILGSSFSVLDLVDEHGLAPAEAGEIVGWAIRALIEEARRTKEVG